MNIWALCRTCINNEIPDTNIDFSFNYYKSDPLDKIDINNIQIDIYKSKNVYISLYT